MTPYAAMRKQAKRHKLPLRFPTDLTTHDRAWTQARDPRKPFVWFLYEDGTHIADATGPSLAAELVAVMDRGWGTMRRVWYRWDGCFLVQYKDAADLIAYLEDASRNGPRVPCDVCTDGSCMLCDDTGHVPAEHAR